jgi:hypothetical protein
MKVCLRFPKHSPLHDMFSGVTGELVSQTNWNVSVRVELEGHTSMNPSTALILAVWNHVEVIA